MYSQESPLVESCHRAPEETQGGIPTSASKQTEFLADHSFRHDSSAENFQNSSRAGILHQRNFLRH
jgi:hypothetical protein